MQKINSLDDLNLPCKYINFLQKYLNNLSEIPTIEHIILFGSCARGHVHEHSDIDLMIIGDKITDDDETGIFYNCVPDLDINDYVSTDVLVCTHDRYDTHKNEVGYVQRHIELFGIDLTNCLNLKLI